MNPPGESGDARQKRFNDLLGLVKFCLESTKDEDVTSPAMMKPLEPERRDWLENAIRQMTVDVAQEIVGNLTIIKKFIIKIRADSGITEEDTEKASEAFVKLQDMCESLDVAIDFVKLDGLSIFKPIFESKFDELKIKACDLIATISQNNPPCQNQAVLKSALDLFENHDNQSMRLNCKLIYAMSALLRANEANVEHYTNQLDGFSKIVKFFDSGLAMKLKDELEIVHWQKCLIKIAFLTSSMVNHCKVAADKLYSLNILSRFVEALKGELKSEATCHVLSSVSDLLSNEPKTFKEMLETNTNLAEVIRQVQQRISSKDDYDATKSVLLCNEICQILNEKCN